jgi:hypothetical protein
MTMKKSELKQIIKEEINKIVKEDFRIGGFLHYTYNEKTPDLEYPLSNPKDIWTFFKYNFIDPGEMNIGSSLRNCKNEIDFFKLKDQKWSDVDPKYKTQLKNYDGPTFTAGLVRNIERAMKQRKYTDKETAFNKMAMQIYRALF